VPEYAAKRLSAANLFGCVEWVVKVGPHTNQRLIPFPLMRTCRVIVLDVSPYKVVKVTQSDSDEAIEALVPDRADPPFNESVLVGGLRSSRCDRYLSLFEDFVEPLRILEV
jgi:hypothetical protein